MEYSPKIDFYQKRQFGDKLNITFVFIRENAWPYLKVQMLVAGPILLLINILMSQTQLSLLDPMQLLGSDDFISELGRIYGLVFLNVLLTGSLVPALGYGYMQAYQHKAPKEISLADVTKGLGKRFGLIFGYGLVFFIVVIISSFFFLIPGVFFFTVLSLGTAIIVFEGSDPFTAFGRCFSLIKDKFFSTLGLIVVIFFIGYFVNMLFSLPQSIVYGIWAFTSLDGGTLNPSEMPAYMQVLTIVFAVFVAFGSILTYSFIYIGLAFQYFNLVERRESRGLMERIHAMDQEQQDDEEETY